LERHQIYVLDANICIDLFQGELLVACLDLPFSFTIPDFIYSELIKPQGLVAVLDRIRASTLTGDQVRRVYVTRQDKRYSRLSVSDIAAFVLAEDLGATLLTGDQDLRRIATERGVRCHGILWLLDTLVDCGRIWPAEAASSLERILAHGAGLPKHECEARLSKWKGEQRQAQLLKGKEVF